MSNILVIDDDKGIRELLKSYLKNVGFKVDSAKDTKAADGLIDSNQYDLIVCDIMMQGENGFEFTKRYKESGGKTPIILLSAMGEAANRIEGLEKGADDYLTKPFEPKELELRINKLIKRFNLKTKVSDDKENKLISFGDFEFDKQTRKLLKDGQRVNLSPKEADLLHYFTSNVGVAIDRYDLAKLFNGISDRSIDVQVTRLRAKIETDSKNPEFLQTDWGKGYVFRI